MTSRNSTCASTHCSQTLREPKPTQLRVFRRCPCKRLSVCSMAVCCATRQCAQPVSHVGCGYHNQTHLEHDSRVAGTIASNATTRGVRSATCVGFLKQSFRTNCYGEVQSQLPVSGVFVKRNVSHRSLSKNTVCWINVLTERESPVALSGFCVIALTTFVSNDCCDEDGWNYMAQLRLQKKKPDSITCVESLSTPLFKSKHALCR